jgi:hypothetical protein
MPIYLLAILLATFSLSPLMAQDKKKDPKIDSLMVTLSMARQDALDAVVAAFQANGLQVTNTTSSMVEADLGKKAGTLAVFERKVRALVLGSSNNATKVMIVGDEIRYADNANPLSYRIDNRAKSEGGKIWKKMAAVSKQLEGAAGPKPAQAAHDVDTLEREAPSASSAQPGPATGNQSAPQPSQWRVDDVPPGTNWVADAKAKIYYRVGCPATTKITATDRLFYGNETSLQAAGFTKAQEC